MDLSILLRTAHEQVVTVVMSYRALPPEVDYLIIADETTLVYADDVLRDHARVLVSAADHGSYDTAALDRQNIDFFASIVSGSEPVSSAAPCAPRWRHYRRLRTSSTAGKLGWVANQHRGVGTRHSRSGLVDLVNMETRTRRAGHGASGGRAIFSFSS